MSKSWTWRHAIAKSELPATTKHVLLTISIHMDETGGGAYPTIDLLAQETSLSRRVVILHIRNAINAGWLRSKVHGFAGQKWKNHEYEANWPEENQGEIEGEIDQKGGYPKSLPPEKVVTLMHKGGYPNDKKVVTQGNPSIPDNIPIKTRGKKSVSAGSSKKGHRLPLDWAITESLIEFAQGEGFTICEAKREADKFFDYWQSASGKNAIKVKWDMAFRNWIRNSADRRRLEKSKSKRETLNDLLMG